MGANLVPEVDVQVSPSDSVEMVFDPFGNLADCDIYIEDNQVEANEGTGGSGVPAQAPNSASAQGQQQQSQSGRSSKQQQQHVAGSYAGDGTGSLLGGAMPMPQQPMQVAVDGAMNGTALDATLLNLEMLTLDQLIQVNLKIAEKMANNDYVPEDIL